MLSHFAACFPGLLNMLSASVVSHPSPGLQAPSSHCKLFPSLCNKVLEWVMVYESGSVAAPVTKPPGVSQAWLQINS